MLDAPPSLYHLQTFHVVAIERSFARAAERLDLPETVVSGHLQALERHYGTSLVAVRHRRVYLTNEGAALYEYAERVFGVLEAAKGIAAATPMRADEHLVLGASSTIAHHLLPPVLSRFTRAHPGTRVTVSIGTSAQTIAQVLAGAVPFGLVAVPVAEPDLDAQSFATDEVVLVTLPEHPWADEAALRLDVLDGAPFIRREPGSATRALVDSRLAGVGVSVATAVELGSTEALKQAVLADVGVAWIPRLAVLRELAVGILVAVPVPGVDLHRPISLVTRRGASLSPVDDDLLRLLYVANPLDSDALGGTHSTDHSPRNGLSPAERRAR
jgi:DNA-binding transcriptional LysR family regulator